MDHSEFYRLFTHYWWLIFAIGWGVAGLVRVWIRHREAQQALEVLKSYADQGKDPPAELMRMLSGPARPNRPPLDHSRRFLFAGLIFVASAVAFAILWRSVGNDADNAAGLLFVVVLMGGFAVAFFIGAYVFARDARRSEKP